MTVSANQFDFSRHKSQRTGILNARAPFNPVAAVARWLTVSLVLFAVATLGTAQNPPQLQISSPTNGSIVNPGQTLSVTVISPTNVTFAKAGVIGQDPLGFSDIATSVPAQFNFAIPADIACGAYMLTAYASTSSGQSTQSATILIDVERPDLPISLSTLMSGISFEAQGEQSPVVVLAKFADGAILDATRSSNIAFSTANASIATVAANGIVTGLSAGNTTVTATYTLGGQSVQVNVPVSLPAPLLGPSPASLTFPSQAVGTSSSSQSLTLTNVSNQTIKVLSVGTTGDFSESDNCVSSSPLTASAACTINVAFTPSAAGTRPGTVTIANSFSFAPMAIPLTGTGAAAPAPTITSLSPNSGALGTSVTITGTNFGSTQGTSTVTFNGTTATPTSWTTTSIVAPVPSGATTGNVVVNVGGTASNGVNFTVQGTTNGIVLVQHIGKDAGTTASSSLAFNSNNAAGNWIGVCVRAGLSGQTFTVTDSNANNYRQAIQINDTLDTPNGNTLAIFYAENVRSGANTVTVSDTASGTLRFAILEFTGVATANSLDVTVAAQGTSTSPNCGNVTTTANGDLLLGAIATADAASFTTPSGVEIMEHVPAEPNTKLIADYQIQSAAGSTSATASLAASDPWGVVLAAFKKAHP
jgi:hypothetical protein